MAEAGPKVTPGKLSNWGSSWAFQTPQCLSPEFLRVCDTDVRERLWKRVGGIGGLIQAVASVPFPFALEKLLGCTQACGICRCAHDDCCMLSIRDSAVADITTLLSLYCRKVICASQSRLIVSCTIFVPESPI